MFRFIGLALLLVAGFALAFTAEGVNDVENRGMRILAGWSFLKLLGVLIAGPILTLLLVKYAEFTLALFFVVGSIKGDPRLASAPVDLTLAVGAIVVIAILARICFGTNSASLPREYILYIPILAMMIVSLLYTPNLAAGLDKVGRFIFLTSLGIAGQFILLDTPAKLRRFFYVLISGGVILALNSLAGVGGSERLVAPSGLNTELGFATGLAMIILWGLVFPSLKFSYRLFFYPVLGLVGVGLVGSGGRTANVAAAICVLLALLFCKKLWKDVAVLCCLGVLALSLLQVPQASLDYLASLAHPSQAMGTRNGLMDLGVTLAVEHPVLGVGIQGFKFLSPNPMTYNYPHNMFLELGAELGIVPVLAYLALSIVSFREIFVRMRNTALENKYLTNTVLLVMIFSYLDAMVSGDMNDRRLMWCALGMPFLLRQFAWSESEVTSQVVPSDLRPVQIEEQQSAQDGEWELS
ncbi:MAG TPA: O-antigen ligase family protein [Candidatus Acidoferrum sp.]